MDHSRNQPSHFFPTIVISVCSTNIDNKTVLQGNLDGRIKSWNCKLIVYGLKQVLWEQCKPVIDHGGQWKNTMCHSTYAIVEAHGSLCKFWSCISSNFGVRPTHSEVYLDHLVRNSKKEESLFWYNNSMSLKCWVTQVSDSMWKHCALKTCVSWPTHCIYF